MQQRESKCRMRAPLWHLGVECPVTNQLRLDFTAFTSKLLGIEFVSLALYANRTDFSAKK
jgi:hypothetical protein